MIKLKFQLIISKEIFQATANFDTKMYIFLIPTDIRHETEAKVLHSVDTIVNELQSFFNSPEKIKYMVKLLHITDVALLSVDEYKVILSGIAYQPPELALWYEAEFDSQVEEKKIPFFKTGKRLRQLLNATSGGNDNEIFPAIKS